MRYLCLAYYDPEEFERLTVAEQEAIASECAPLDAELRASGRLISVASLSHRTGVALKPSEGGTLVTDGPYLETKEVVGSFFIIEAEDLEEATRIASLHPAARWGERLGFGVEVRQIELLDEFRSERGIDDRS